VAEKNRTKALAPTAVFWSPNRRTGGEQLSFVKRCLRDLIFFLIITPNLLTPFVSLNYFCRHGNPPLYMDVQRRRIIALLFCSYLYCSYLPFHT